MNFNELVRKTRTCRRFKENVAINRNMLCELIDLARQSASGGNLQPLKYMLSCTPDRNAALFPCLAWAAYLKDWDGPVPGERPAAYIIILHDTRISKPGGHDAGIAAQTIMLGAAGHGLLGCMIGSVNRVQLRTELQIPAHFEIILVLALGQPAETIVEEEAVHGEIKYWRDAQGVHHVPKRPLTEIIV